MSVNAEQGSSRKLRVGKFEAALCGVAFVPSRWFVRHEPGFLRWEAKVTGGWLKWPHRRPNLAPLSSTNPEPEKP